MEWLVVRYEQVFQTKWPSSFQKHLLQLPIYSGAFDRFVERRRGCFVTCSYAVAEIQRHQRDAERGVRAEPRSRQQKRAAFRERFWTFAVRELSALQIDERHFSLGELQADLVHEFGPGDASLIEVSRQLHAEKVRPTVVTQDRGLVSICRQLELSAEPLDAVLAEFIESE